MQAWKYNHRLPIIWKRLTLEREASSKKKNQKKITTEESRVKRAANTWIWSKYDLLFPEWYNRTLHPYLIRILPSSNVIDETQKSERPTENGNKLGR